MVAELVEHLTAADNDAKVKCSNPPMALRDKMKCLGRVVKKKKMFGINTNVFATLYFLRKLQMGPIS